MGNNVEGYEKAFALDHCDGGVVMGNNFYKCSSETVAGSEAAAKNPATYAISVFGSQNLTISNNQFYFCQACCIRIKPGNLAALDAVDIAVVGNVGRRSGSLLVAINVLYISVTGNVSALENGGFLNYYFDSCKRGIVSSNVAFNDTALGTLFYSEDGDVMQFHACRGRFDINTGKTGVYILNGTKEFVGDTLVDGSFTDSFKQVLFDGTADGESHEPYERGRVANDGTGAVTLIEHTTSVI
jgi:hypothetical protein